MVISTHTKRLRFIGDSSQSVSLLGVSSTHLDNSSFQPTNHNQHRNHIALKLLAEGSVVVLLMALGWWGMCNLGSYTLLSQTQPEPIYVAGCPVSEPLQKRARRGEGVLARAEDVQRKALLTRSARASRE